MKMTKSLIEAWHIWEIFLYKYHYYRKYLHLTHKEARDKAWWHLS